MACIILAWTAMASAATNACHDGVLLWAQSRFEAAEKAWVAGLDEASTAACSHLGLARLEQLRFRRASARDHVAAAYRLAPRDPDIILAYAGYTRDARARRTLLENVIALSAQADTRQEAVTRLRLEEGLRGRNRTLSSPYTAYELRLETAPDALILKTSINGGKPLRLILDTGADGIVLNSSAARKLDLEPLVAPIALAHSVAIGDLAWSNCPVRVHAANPASGADGVIGANLFQEFEISIHPARRTLRLEPQPAPPGPAHDPWAAYDAPRADARRIGELLLVPADLDGRAQGYFLLDTGAAQSLISLGLAPQAGSTRRTFAEAALATAFTAPPVTLGIAGRNFREERPLASDLSEISRREGVAISGFLGYSLLSRTTLTINYREGTVRLTER